MNLASLSTLDANDPLPLALGPRHELPPAAPPHPGFDVRLVGDKFVCTDRLTGKMDARPAEFGAFLTWSDYPNRNPYMRKPSQQVMDALSKMDGALGAKPPSGYLEYPPNDHFYRKY